MRHRNFKSLIVGLCGILASSSGIADDLRPIALQSKVTHVQPMTGIVLWASNQGERSRSAPVQLEFSYVGYDRIVDEKGDYDWTALETILDAVASRGRQAVIRWHDTYVGKPTTIPAAIKALPDYHETLAKSEKKPTGFPDWSHPALRRFILDFFDRFAEKYDRDPRLAFVEVGFGLWAEYHNYDGPMELGKTFPAIEFQRDFASRLGEVFHQTPWMISVDAAADWAPFGKDEKLLGLPFGVFDDSFNHARHKEVNEPNWDRLGRDRWKIAPAGGEFSFYEPKDQKAALAPEGPHGVSFEQQAAKFHVSFIIGDGQPRFQKPDRIRTAGMACGYRFRVAQFQASPTRAVATVTNTGIAPIYYDAFPALNGVRSEKSLKGMLPGQSWTFPIASGGESPTLTIECDRLVPGQRIEFDADLP